MAFRLLHTGAIKEEAKRSHRDAVPHLQRRCQPPAPPPPPVFRLIPRLLDCFRAADQYETATETHSDRLSPATRIYSCFRSTQAWECEIGLTRKIPGRSLEQFKQAFILDPLNVSRRISVSLPRHGLFFNKKVARSRSLKHD